MCSNFSNQDLAFCGRVSLHLRKLVITVCCCFINSLFPDSWDKMCVSDDVLTHGIVLGSFWIILFTFKILRIVVVFGKQNTLNLFLSIKNDILTKLEQRKYQACNISTYDFLTLYTTLSHTLIETKLKPNLFYLLEILFFN